jgi:hypothetical protein
MILLSGMTDDAILIVLVIFLGLALVSHYILFKIAGRIKFLQSFLHACQRNKFYYFIFHLCLFIFSCFILYGILYLKFYLTGEGLS